MDNSPNSCKRKAKTSVSPGIVCRGMYGRFRWNLLGIRVDKTGAQASETMTDANTSILLNQFHDCKISKCNDCKTRE
jgi:hypothetical protein